MPGPPILPINGSIQLSYETLAAYTAWNDILKEGQVSVVSDAASANVRIKIGDGVLEWNDLPFYSPGSQTLEDVLGVGNSTGGNTIYSPDTRSQLQVINGQFLLRFIQGIYSSYNYGTHDFNISLYTDGSAVSKTFLQATSWQALFDLAGAGGSITIEDETAYFTHTTKVVLDSPTIKIEQGTASKLLRLNANKEIVPSSLDDADIATVTALGLKLDASAYIQHFLGLFTTLGALQTAYPTALSGDYAQVDPGTGTDLATYAYDIDEGWVLSNAAGSGAVNTDGLPEGATNLYFTNGRALSAAPAETTTTEGALINSAASKATPVDADYVGLMDSAAGNILKKLSWANFKATLKTYFDTLYTYSVKATSAEINTGTDDDKFATALGIKNSSILTQYQAKTYAVATGTDTYAAAFTPAITALTAGITINVLFTNANTGAVTLNVDTLGAKAITKDGLAALVAGDLKAGVIYSMTYDGTRWQCDCGEALIDSPVFSNQITTPKIIGGTAVGSYILNQSTTGVGTTTALAHQFTGGTNGASVITSMYNDGQFIITTPTATLTRNPATVGTFRIIQDSGGNQVTMDFGRISNSTGAIWFNQPTPSTTNYVLNAGANGTSLNAGATLSLLSANVTKIAITASTQVFTPGAVSTGAPIPFTLTAPASTNQTLSTEINGFTYSLATNRQWATGALATQREFLISAPTYRFVGASTISDAATLAISGSPIASTNATITRSMAIWVQAGTARFDGNVQIGNAAVTGLTAGALAATTNASIVLYDNSGTAYRIPCIV